MPSKSYEQELKDEIEVLDIVTPKELKEVLKEEHKDHEDHEDQTSFIHVLYFFDVLHSHKLK